MEAQCCPGLHPWTAQELEKHKSRRDPKKNPAAAGAGAPTHTQLHGTPTKEKKGETKEGRGEDEEGEYEGEEGEDAEFSPSLPPTRLPPIQSGTLSFGVVVQIRSMADTPDHDYVAFVELHDRLASPRGFEKMVYRLSPPSSTGEIKGTFSIPCPATLSPDAMISVVLRASRSPDLRTKDVNEAMVEDTHSLLRMHPARHRYIGRTLMSLYGLLSLHTDQTGYTKPLHTAMLGRKANAKEGVYSPGHIRAYVRIENVKLQTAPVRSRFLEESELPDWYVPLNATTREQLQTEEKHAETRKVKKIRSLPSCPETPEANNMFPLAFYDTGQYDTQMLHWLLSCSPYTSNEMPEAMACGYFHTALLQREVAEHTLRDWVQMAPPRSRTWIAEQRFDPMLLYQMSFWVKLPFSVLSAMELRRLLDLAQDKDQTKMITEACRLSALAVLVVTKYVTYAGDDVVVFGPFSSAPAASSGPAPAGPGVEIGGVDAQGKAHGHTYPEPPWECPVEYVSQEAFNRMMRKADGVVEPTLRAFIITSLNQLRLATPENPGTPFSYMEVMVDILTATAQQTTSSIIAGDYYGNGIADGAIDCEDAGDLLFFQGGRMFHAAQRYENDLVFFVCNITSSYYELTMLMVSAWAMNMVAAAAAAENAATVAAAVTAGTSPWCTDERPEMNRRDRSDITGHQLAGLVPKRMLRAFAPEGSGGPSNDDFEDEKYVARWLSWWISKTPVAADYRDLKFVPQIRTLNTLRLEGTAITEPTTMPDPQHDIVEALSRDIRQAGARITNWLKVNVDVQAELNPDFKGISFALRQVPDEASSARDARIAHLHQIQACNLITILNKDNTFERLCVTASALGFTPEARCMYTSQKAKEKQTKYEQFYDSVGTVACISYAKKRIIRAAVVGSVNGCTSVGVPMDDFIEFNNFTRRGGHFMAIDTCTDDLAFKNKLSMGELLPTCPAELPIQRYGPIPHGEAGIAPGKNLKDRTAIEAMQNSESIMHVLVESFNASRAATANVSAGMSPFAPQACTPIAYCFRAGRVTKDWGVRVLYVLQEVKSVNMLETYNEYITDEISGVVLVVYVKN